MKGVAKFFAVVGIILLVLVSEKTITAMEAVIVFIVLLLPFVAYGLGLLSGRSETEKKLAGEKSALDAERTTMLSEMEHNRVELKSEAERNRAELESGKRENEETAKMLEQKGRKLSREKSALKDRERIVEKSGEQRHEAMLEMEREIKRAGEEKSAALQREREDFMRHQKSLQQQHEFLRNYFLRRSRIDAYIGQDALRKCGGVYIISRQDGLVKVGMTEDDFSRRFKEVDRDCRKAGIVGIQPEILVPMDEGILAVEQKVHKEFSANREAGEWFRVSVKDAVSAVMSAAWRQHLHNTKNRKYIEPPNSNEGNKVRGDRHIPHG